MVVRRFLCLVFCVFMATGCHNIADQRCATCHPDSCAASVLPPGIYPTVVSPYTCTGVDIPALEGQLHYQLANGVTGLVLLGTIGEGHLLNDQERGDVIATAARVSARKVPIVVGIHTHNVNVALAQMHQARDLGATVALVKYYGNPGASDEQVLAFFTALSNAYILPILIYHYPNDTGLRLAAATIQAILRLANVIGIKESTLNLRAVAGHMEGCRGKLFFSATALDLTQFLKMGGHGAMCPEAMLLPRHTVECYEAARAGFWDQARMLQEDLYELVPVYRRRPTAPELSRAVLMTAFDHQMRLPLRNDPSSVRLKEALNCLGIPTPTFVKPGQDELTACDVRSVRRTMDKARHLAQ
jgi:4-hydroxy-tetrahydrodipicolinate synthase